MENALYGHLFIRQHNVESHSLLIFKDFCQNEGVLTFPKEYIYSLYSYEIYIYIYSESDSWICNLH